MEGILLPPRCDRKSLLWISSADKRADGEEDPRDRTFPTNLLPRPPELLEPVSGLGRVRTKLPSPTVYRAHSFPVRARLPAPSLPLVRRTIRGAIGRPLVPREPFRNRCPWCWKSCTILQCQNQDVCWIDTHVGSSSLPVCVYWSHPLIFLSQMCISS